MNLVLYIILRLLSRPVVCADFQGLEANTFFQLAESIKDTVYYDQSTSTTKKKARGLDCLAKLDLIAKLRNWVQLFHKA